MASNLNDTSGMTEAQREAHWRAQDDARILADAETIKRDPERLEAATDMAKRMAEERIEDARSMSKVASTLFDNTTNKEK